MALLEAGIAFLERILGALMRLRERGMTPTRRMIREARQEEKALLREIRLADDSEHAVRRLADDVIKLSGDFQLRLHETRPDLEERFREMSPGIPESVTLNTLRRAVRADLTALREIERHLAWPVWLLKLRRLLRRNQ